MAKKKEKKRSSSKANHASKARSRQRTEQEILRARREARHKRRIRSTILCWILLIILIIGAVAGIMVAGHKISDVVAKKNQEKAEKIRQEEAQKEEAEEAEASELEKEDNKEDAPEEYTEEDLLNDMIINCMAEMGVEERVAGLILSTPEDLVGEENVTKAGDKTEAALSTIPVGGIVYHKNNVENENQFSEMLIDTIDRSKYPLFLALNDTESSLNTDVLTEYGINFKIENDEEDGSMVKGLPLPDDSSAGELKVLILDGSKDNIVEEMEKGLDDGADMIYITKNVNDAYGKFLDAVKENTEIKDKVDKALENIYRIKYSGRLSE